MEGDIIVQQIITPTPLTRDAFAPFGTVIETNGATNYEINKGTTRRFHALAQVEIEKGDAILSIFRGQAFAPPVEIMMMERHPLGSQAFVPLQDLPWLVVVAPDENGEPGTPVAFLAAGCQGVQYGHNIWHHPLISLKSTSDFLIVDRQGDGDNLEEADYPEPYLLTL